MPKRKKKAANVSRTSAAADRLAKSLAKAKKAELVDVLVDLAVADRQILRQLEERFAVEAPPKELIAATRQAIRDATDFDAREINRNFDYDWRAYQVIRRNFGRLIHHGRLHDAMKLSLDLMKLGSYQVEMSDEGLMTNDIEACLEVVIQALRKSDLPANEVAVWCRKMAEADRGGFIAEESLRALREGCESR